MKKPETASSTLPEGYDYLIGTDPVIRELVRTKAPLTRENYLMMAGLTEEEVEAGREAEIPEFLQRGAETAD